MPGSRHRVVPAGVNRHGEETYAVTLSATEMDELVRLILDEPVDEDVLEELRDRLQRKLDAAWAVNAAERDAAEEGEWLP